MDPLSGDEAASDEALVARANDGSRAALESLLLRHEPGVLRLLRLLGVPGPDREDVAQEILIRVFRYLSGFKAGRSFRGWLYSITVNAVHDFKKQSHRRTRVESPWDSDAAERLAVPFDPFEGIDRKERESRLEQILAALSERERAVFVLCEMEELETREVARALGITAITVRRHLGRARRHIGRLLRAAPTDPDVDRFERPDSS